MWDKRYVILPNDIECPNGIDVVIMKDATVEDRNQYLFWKEQEEMRSRMLDVPTEGQVFANARINGYWTDDDELILKEADDHIQYLEHELDRKGFAARKRQIEAQIESTKQKKLEVIRKETHLKSQTAEYLAHEIAATRMMLRLVRDSNDNAFWNDEAEFLETRNRYPEFIQYLLYQMLSEDVWEISTLREIARAPEWRMIWILERNNLSDLFNRPVGDLTVNQRLLIYWSRVYDSALEGVEPPEEYIINNDDKFDEWLANRDLDRKEKQETAKRKNTSYRHQEQIMVLDGEYVETCECGVGSQNGVPLGMRKQHASHCHFGTWREYTEQERDALASQFYSRNNMHMRKYLDKEQDKVLRNGVVKEQDLRDRNSRKILGANTNVTPIRRK